MIWGYGQKVNFYVNVTLAVKNTAIITDIKGWKEFKKNEKYMPIQEGIFLKILKLILLY